MSQRLKIGLIGPTGQLGSAILRAQAISGIDCEITSLGRPALDFLNSEPEIKATLTSLGHVDVIINATAYTAVDDAETHEKTAFAVNETAPRIIAEFCKAKSLPLIHISTDYVFSGKIDTPILPGDMTDPKSVYGHSKQLGEINVQAAGCNYAILRTSWLYGAHHKNFFTTMLKLSDTRDAVQVVGDQFGRPTFVDELARATLLAAQKISQNPSKYTGVFHVTDKGSVVSWADFAREIFRLARPHIGKEMTTHTISTADFGARAERPAYSTLDTSSFEETFDIQLQDWQLNLQTAILQRYKEPSD